MAQAHHLFNKGSVIAAQASCPFWCGGAGAICVDWDQTVGEPIGQNPQTGEMILAGGTKLTSLSIHEFAVEPGTRNAEKGRWWIRGLALPPAEVQETYNLEDLPKADARAIDSVWRSSEGERATNVPLTRVYVYYERPNGRSDRDQVDTQYH